jgi:hypothetical protein
VMKARARSSAVTRSGAVVTSPACSGGRSIYFPSAS